MLGAMQRKQLDDERESSLPSSANMESDRKSGVRERPTSTQTKGGGPSQQARRKAPSFKESVDIIGISSGSHMIRTPDEDDSKVLESPEDVLEGRKQVQHSIPKDGPLKFSIQGGTDTVHGGRILISHIQEGGAAHKYALLNVGDQILKLEGESLVGVTHEQAARVIKAAMASSSHTLNMVLAQIPGGDSEGRSPNTLSQI